MPLEAFAGHDITLSLKSLKLIVNTLKLPRASSVHYMILHKTSCVYNIS